MHPVISYDEIIADLTSHFVRDIDLSVKLIGILFALPNAEITKNEILKHLDWYHVRSGKYIDFYCAGYGPASPNDPKAIYQQELRIRGWYFNPIHIDSVARKIEKTTGWRFNGETTLILTNAKYDKVNYQSYIDFDSMIACNLEEMVKIGAIRTVRGFFDKIFEYAEKAPKNDPTWGFSDKMGLQKISEALISFVASLLPGDLENKIRRIAVFALRK
jgi:hypothetical protein